MFPEKATPDFVAVVLASSVGTRLFPLTSSPRHPKHLLPVAGIPLLHRLLTALHSFPRIIVCIQHEDTVTIPSLQQQQEQVETSVTDTNTGTNIDELPTVQTVSFLADPSASSSSKTPRLITVVRLTEDCPGTAQALRQVDLARDPNPTHDEPEPLIPLRSHVAVFPGDLMVLDDSFIPQLLQQHRFACATGSAASSASAAFSSSVHSFPRQQHAQQHKLISHAACTVLLTDVGEQDEHGAPLKESAKPKKGGLARDDEEIEYVAIANYSSKHPDENRNSNDHHNTANYPRLVWKEPKLQVEHDEGVGTSAKLQLPRALLSMQQTTSTTVRTDWNDVHVYVLAPWVRLLLHARGGPQPEQTSSSNNNMVSLREDLLPLLIARQFKGMVATFGKNINTNSSNQDNADDPRSTWLKTAVQNFPQWAASRGGAEGNALDGSLYGAEQHNAATDASGHDDASAGPLSAFAVGAVVVPGQQVVRSQSVAAYLYSNRQVVQRSFDWTTKAGTASSSAGGSNGSNQKPAYLQFPSNCKAKAKFSSILLSGATASDKVNFKSTVVGSNCTVGSKCRLNNTVLLDGVTLGDNVVLQNTVVGAHAQIGDNCNLNDCQVGSSKKVPQGTKQKGEALLSELDGL